MAKLSKSERAECEKNLAVCRAACETFQAMLDSDDAADKATKAASHAAVIQGIADRDGVKTAIMAIRETGRRGGPAE